MNKIVAATRFPRAEMGWKWYLRQPPFQGATVHLRFDILRICLAGFNRTDGEQWHAQVAYFF